MSTTYCNNEESTDAHPDDVGDYVYEQLGLTHTWTHTETGVRVRVSRTSSYERAHDETGYYAIARSAPGQEGELVDEITDRYYLNFKADAIAAAVEWMRDHPDGDVQTGDR